MNLFSRNTLRDVARVFHDVGQVLPGQDVVTPTRAAYLATAEDAGVPVAVLQAIWQIESRQVALLAGEPLKRIEAAVWKRFGGDPRDLPKPLNPGGATPEDTREGQKRRLANFHALAAIDPIRAIVVTSHGGPQIMGFNAELAGFADELAFLQAMQMGANMQLVAMSRFIRHPKNAAMRNAMQKRDVETIAHHWNGPGFRRNDYHTKLAAGIRRFV
jgi:hypothetical protein